MPRQIPTVQVRPIFDSTTRTIREAPEWTIRESPEREIRQTPRNVVAELQSPVTQQISVPRPVTQTSVPRPVIGGIKPPIVDIPDTSIEYPTIDVPTEAELAEGMNGGSNNNQPDAPQDTRDLPTTPEITQPTIEVGGIEIPLPDPGPLVAAGSLAVVTTVVTLGATIGVQQAKTALEPVLKKLLSEAGKKKKIKVKQVKPVLHFIPNDDGTTEVLQYSQKGMKVLEGGIEKLEQYLRDQVEIDAFWEYDNKIIIDEELGEQLTKEGQKRFKKYFAAPKVIAKKLGAKFAF